MTEFECQANDPGGSFVSTHRTERDHAAMKRILGCCQSFRSSRKAKATPSRVETIRTIKEGYVHHEQPGVQGKIACISQRFMSAA